MQFHLSPSPIATQSWKWQKGGCSFSLGDLILWEAGNSNPHVWLVMNRFSPNLIHHSHICANIVKAISTDSN